MYKNFKVFDLCHPGLAMSWLFHLGLAMSWLFHLGLAMSWLFNSGLAMSWLCHLGLAMSWLCQCLFCSGSAATGMAPAAEQWRRRPIKTTLPAWILSFFLLSACGLCLSLFWIQYCFNAGTTSLTLAQHWNNIALTFVFLWSLVIQSAKYWSHTTIYTHQT